MGKYYGNTSGGGGGSSGGSSSSGGTSAQAAPKSSGQGLGIGDYGNAGKTSSAPAPTRSSSGTTIYGSQAAYEASRAGKPLSSGTSAVMPTVGSKAYQQVTTAQPTSMAYPQGGFGQQTIRTGTGSESIILPAGVRFNSPQEFQRAVETLREKSYQSGQQPDYRQMGQQLSLMGAPPQAEMTAQAVASPLGGGVLSPIDLSRAGAMSGAIAGGGVSSVRAGALPVPAYEGETKAERARRASQIIREARGVDVPSVSARAQREQTSYATAIREAFGVRQKQTGSGLRASDFIKDYQFEKSGDVYTGKVEKLRESSRQLMFASEAAREMAQRESVNKRYSELIAQSVAAEKTASAKKPLALLNAFFQTSPMYLFPSPNVIAPTKSDKAMLSDITTSLVTFAPRRVVNAMTSDTVNFVAEVSTAGYFKPNLPPIFKTPAKVQSYVAELDKTNAPPVLTLLGKGALAAYEGVGVGVGTSTAAGALYKFMPELKLITRTKTVTGAAAALLGKYIYSSTKENIAQAQQQGFSKSASYAIAGAQFIGGTAGFIAGEGAGRGVARTVFGKDVFRPQTTPAKTFYGKFGEDLFNVEKNIGKIPSAAVSKTKEAYFGVRDFLKDKPASDSLVVEKANSQSFFDVNPFKKVSVETPKANVKDVFGVRPDFGKESFGQAVKESSKVKTPRDWFEPVSKGKNKGAGQNVINTVNDVVKDTSKKSGTEQGKTDTGKPDTTAKDFLDELRKRDKRIEDLERNAREKAAREEEKARSKEEEKPKTKEEVPEVPPITDPIVPAIAAAALLGDIKIPGGGGSGGVASGFTSRTFAKSKGYAPSLDAYVFGKRAKKGFNPYREFGAGESRPLLESSSRKLSKPVKFRSYAGLSSKDIAPKGYGGYLKGFGTSFKNKKKSKKQKFKLL